jgi:carbon starvation protein
MEAFGWKGMGGRWVATFLTLAVPALVLLVPPVSIGGAPQPLWRVFWGIFGSSNQLLAALALLGLTFWLARTGSFWWVSFFPCLIMMVMTQWSLLLNVRDYVMKLRTGGVVETMAQVQFAINCSLLFLSIWLLVEALIIAGRIHIFGKRR